ncbi:MAG TPA: hypothetical protein PKA27_09770 [Fimbriimonadaceae bacterium]|nr:hypothetical protein [Fimbriimonadaceae bacterium]
MEEQPKPGWFDIVLALVVTAAIYFAGFFAATYAESWGWALFYFSPLTASFAGTWALCRSKMFTFQQAWTVQWIALVLAGLGMLVFLIEGVICLIMAAPVYGLATAAGTALCRWVIETYSDPKPAQLSLLAVFPIALAVETRSSQEPWYDTIETSILISSSPNEIWPYLSNLDIPEKPKEFLFARGVAHTIEVRTFGEGVGARRDCVLSTGTMPETITVWEPPRHLRFEVHATPESMKEMNPFGHVDTDHLVGYFTCHFGEFELEQTASGSTILTGRSTYSCRFGPKLYWQLWTRKIVRDTHLRVMNKVRDLSQASRTLDRATH